MMLVLVKTLINVVCTSRAFLCVFIQEFGLIFFQDWYLLNYELMVIFLPLFFFIFYF